MSQPASAPTKNRVEVSAALIFRAGRLLITQRHARSHLGGLWEFPGGKIEAGETAEECLIRELREELGVSVFIGSALSPATHSYQDFTVTLYPFICSLTGGTVTMHEHHALKWVEPQQMPELDWAAADLPVISEYLVITAENATI